LKRQCKAAFELPFYTRPIEVSIKPIKSILLTLYQFPKATIYVAAALVNFEDFIPEINIFSVPGTSKSIVHNYQNGKQWPTEFQLQ
jgi:hypothetical protein